MPKNDVTQYQLKFDGLDNFQLFAVSELTWPIDPYKQNRVQLVFWNEGKRKDFFSCVLILNVRDDSFSKDLAKWTTFFGFFPSLSVLLLFLSKIFHAKICTFVENVTYISYYLVISSKKWDMFHFFFCKVIANFIPLHRAEDLFVF